MTGVASRKADSMTRHAAYGRSIESLDVVVVEDSRNMQTILRSMLTGLGVAKLRIYDRADVALKDMALEPPHLVVSDWRMEPMSGLRMLHAMRHRRMLPLCFVPLLIVTGHATREFVESAFRAGAHQLVVKPVAPSVLAQRLDWVVRDARPFRLEGDRYLIEGVEDMLQIARMKSEMHAMLANGLRARKSGEARAQATAPAG